MGNHDWDDRTKEEIAKDREDQEKAIAAFLLGPEGQKMLKLQEKYRDLRELESLESRWNELHNRSYHGVGWKYLEDIMKDAKSKAGVH